MEPIQLQRFIRQTAADINSINRDSKDPDFHTLKDDLNTLDNHGGPLPEYVIGKTVWRDPDAWNMTTEAGWNLSWRASNITELVTRLKLPFNNSWIKTVMTFGGIPHVGILFHRRVSFCQVSFKAEIFDETLPGKALGLSIWLYMGIKDGLPVLLNSQGIKVGEGDRAAWRFHFQSEDSGISTPSLFLFGIYYGRFEPGEEERMLNLTIRNLVIRERLEHQLVSEWFRQYQ